MNNLPYIIVLGNEKGGSGKTTTSTHLIFSLIERGFKVACLDLDLRQLSLRRYLENRVLNNLKKIEDGEILMPLILEIDNSIINETNISLLEEYYKSLFLQSNVDFIIIDTPGSNTFLATTVHSFADLIITPLNDSLIDLNLIAKIDTTNVKEMKPSIYSAMIWEQKIRRFKRDKRKIEWMVIRNRLSNLDSNNRRFIEKCLNHLSRNLAFRFCNGFSERLIYRELFPYGLTLVDIFDRQDFIKVTPSHIAARQELKNFLSDLRIPILSGQKDAWLNQEYDIYKDIENSNAIINLTDRILSN
jgi:chromosome partitioning protein